MERFAARQSPPVLKELADEFFRLLEPGIPELAGARQLYADGKHAEALDAWKRYWFAKMKQIAKELLLR